MIIFSVTDLLTLLKQYGLKPFLNDLITTLKKDFQRWHAFTKIPRVAFHTEEGVIELMPISNDEYFSFKYVNGHPKNPQQHKLTITALGQLANVSDGYPVFMSEMTLLTALRTAAVSALASELLSRSNATTLGLIGTGAQSEFQAIAHTLIRPIDHIFYYDIDKAAMTKFEQQMRPYVKHLTPAKNSQQVAEKSDILLILTASKQVTQVVDDQAIRPGTHINALGGDTAGKTELSLDTLLRAKIVIEFFQQTYIEGEIQSFSTEMAQNKIHAELWQLLNNEKPARTNDEEITLFDCVGFAMEDFSALMLTYQLAEKFKLGHRLPMIPQLENPKNLFSLLTLGQGET